jgi:endogenous inhibitor of DNA gyrase (YacG/DUF329 family)
LKRDREPLMVTCPACGRRVAYDPRNRWRPFCSERCKTNDLGAWASNAYVIEGAPGEEASSDDDEARGNAPRPNG